MAKKRSPVHLGTVLELADAIGREEKLALSDEGFVEKVGSKVLSLIEQARSNAANVHGIRTELLFGYVAASLGACRAVKREDSGDLTVANGRKVKIPDYRLLLRDGSQQLVEVKNCHHARPTTDLRLREVDVDQLRAYADLFGVTVRFAIYWSRWNVWSLVTQDDMRLIDDKYRICLTEAMANNRMVEIGDFHLATTPPAKLRILTDPAKPRSVGTDGRVDFTIGGTQMFAGETQITQNDEVGLLLYMMFYGKWPESEPEAHIVGEQLEHIDFIAAPLERVPGQPFEIAGAMSGMISRQYNDMTARGKMIHRLAPSIDPSALGRRKPGRVKDMTLPLWVFMLSPEDKSTPREEVE